jgi:hypothetical protein
MPAKQQRLFRIFIVLVGGLTLLISIVWPGIARRVLRPARERDYAAATLQKGIATVTTIIPARPDTFSGRLGPARVLVRYQGRIYEPAEVFGLAELKENQPAQIMYRVGQSGRLYIDSVEPLPPRDAKQP